MAVEIIIASVGFSKQQHHNCVIYYELSRLQSGSSETVYLFLSSLTDLIAVDVLLIALIVMKELAHSLPVFAALQYTLSQLLQVLPCLCLSIVAIATKGRPHTK